MKTLTIEQLRKLAKKRGYQVDLFDGLELIPLPDDSRPYMHFRYYDLRLDRRLGLTAAFAALSALPDAKGTK